jgi:hypothetical protein
MLIKLINKIRSILAPVRECPCVICFNERRLDDDCFEYEGKISPGTNSMPSAARCTAALKLRSSILQMLTGSLNTTNMSKRRSGTRRTGGHGRKPLFPATWWAGAL